MIQKDSLRTAASEKYISYLRLYLGKSKDDVIYIGYPFEVTKREYEILKILIQSPQKALTGERIALLIGGNLTEKNIAYHVFNLNKKSKLLGNREIIKNKLKIGYFLNEEM